jgi:hypothetical protein
MKWVKPHSTPAPRIQRKISSRRFTIWAQMQEGQAFDSAVEFAFECVEAARLLGKRL